MKRGQAIIEIIVAIMMAAIGFLALVQVTNKSVSNSGNSVRQSGATNYSGTIVEWIKSRKDFLTWDVFKGQYNGTYCFESGALLAAGTCDVYEDEGYGNTVTITYSTPVAGQPEQMVVNVTVIWTEANRTGKSTKSAIFTKYY